MKPSHGILTLKLEQHLLGEQRTIFPTLLWDDDALVLVDAGFPGQYDLIKEACEQAGFATNKLTHIIITHQDIDHIGSLPIFVERAVAPIIVMADELEKPFIQGERRLLKFSDEMIGRLDHLPTEVGAPLKRLIANLPKAGVQEILKDGQTLSFGGGIQIIATPGHTPGHMSIYHQATKTLIAGDALVVHNGELHCSAPESTLDMPQAYTSIKRLTAYDIERVICYHGGMFEVNVNHRIAEIAATEV